MSRILVAMSGGVDSSLAAALLVRQSHAQQSHAQQSHAQQSLAQQSLAEAGRDEVIGVTLHLWDYPDEGESRGRCCAPEDIHDARRVCDFLGIPYYAFDRRELFRQEVVDPFVQSYLGGETPSPCVRCNRGVKIPELLAIADSLGADRVATGHYARTALEGGVRRLRRAVDASKDQSYFLHAFGPEVLSRLVFPLGELEKEAVRKEALALGLPGAGKGESQELCFVPNGRYDAFVEERANGGLRPGWLVDGEGKALAPHDGIHRFTIGQRRNLGVATGERAYVTDIEVDTGNVRLGKRDELLSDHALLGDLVLHPGVGLPLECEVAVRYRGVAHPATVLAAPDGGAQVRFATPVSAVVPGQVAVLYRGETVLGGGTLVGQEQPHPRRLRVLGASAS